MLGAGALTTLAAHLPEMAGPFGEVIHPGVGALVLTQLTDVENERNGAVNYDRAPKPNIPINKTGADMLEQTRQWGGPAPPLAAAAATAPATAAVTRTQN